MNINYKTSWQINLENMVRHISTLEDRVAQLESFSQESNTKAKPKVQKAPEQALVDEKDDSTE